MRDPQYIHEMGGVTVRVYPGQGFAWVTNRLRVSDLAQSLDEKLNLAENLLARFQLECGRVSALYLSAIKPRLLPVGSSASGDGAGCVNTRRAVALLWEIFQYCDCMHVRGASSEGVNPNSD